MLQQWLRDRCTPLVATLVTEDADLACRKNNLTFEQLIRYVCILRIIQQSVYAIRKVSDYW